MAEDLAGSDLRNQDLSHRIMFDVDLRGAKLYGAKISLKCEQFDGVKLDNEQVALLLLMIAQADIDRRWQQEIHKTVGWIIGDETYRGLCRLLRLV